MASVRVAVWGCGHGELDRVYDVVRELNARALDGRAIELLICCGDFQAVRNPADLECMACPPKYRHMGSFHRYYSGAAVAPVLTLFVGGNHEAANYNQELFYGGWAAPNIFYLGNAGVVNFRGLRIAGACPAPLRW
jgi:lariat debranching enzyme